MSYESKRSVLLFTLCIISAIVACFGTIKSCQEKQALRAEVQRLEANATATAATIRRSHIVDSINVATITTLRLTIGELEEQRQRDAALIKELRIRPKDVQTITKVETITRDSVIYALRDSVITYADKWVDFSADLADSTLAYSVRDSLTAIVALRYRKRFLWWRWRPVAEVHLVSHNPKASVKWAEQINIED